MRLNLDYIMKETENKNESLEILRHIRMHTIDNLSVPLSQEVIDEVILFLEEICEVRFSSTAVQLMLLLDQESRAGIIGGFDTLAKDGIADMVSNFFLGVNWPKNSDKVDMDKFLEILKKQTQSFGDFSEYTSILSKLQLN